MPKKDLTHGLVWLQDDSPALARSRRMQRLAAKQTHILPFTARKLAQLCAWAEGDGGNPDYVGRHHIPISDDVVVVYPVITVHEGEVLSVRYGSHYVQDEVAA